MATDFDIVVVGAGPVGLALGALMARHDLPPARIALVDGKTLAASIADPRTVALSYGSRQILERIGAWPLASDPIREIHISRRGHFGRTLMKSDEFGVPELGYVCRYGALVEKLADSANRAGLAVMRPLTVVNTVEDEHEVRIALNNGLTVSAQMLVQAEGGLYQQQAQRPLRRDYDQVAIVGHVRASALQAVRAWERFTDEGPLALLPQEQGYALVWCVRPERARDLMALGDGAFLQALQHAFGDRVGRFTAISERHAFPLGLNAYPAGTRRTVAIGNAAQTLHPVAGQGLNLGLRDALRLASLLAHDDSRPDAPARFVRERGADRGLTIRLTDTLARVFAASPAGTPGQHFLSAGLGLLDAVGPAKRLFGEQMIFGKR
ncbi:MAG: UbiH/UbiF/VisC/COQ6 family ubiquinone biosynthesis hydroxylase [Paucimonas sp.]|nr:UbiH/UbiF/VisC/COQ6 family ubiquinone biosynthesis hydroxylase [Paucimonas sp.]